MSPPPWSLLVTVTTDVIKLEAVTTDEQKTREAVIRLQLNPFADSLKPAVGHPSVALMVREQLDGQGP